MANMTLMRFASSLSLSKALGPHALSRMTPAAPGILQKKSLSLTPVSQARVLGPDTSGGSKTSHWYNERILSAALLPIIPAAIIYPNAALDYALSAALILHTHWGFQEFCTDYVHGETFPKVVGAATMFLSVLAFGGLCYLNFNDIGFGNAVRLLFSEL